MQISKQNRPFVIPNMTVVVAYAICESRIIIYNFPDSHKLNLFIIILLHEFIITLNNFT